MYTHVIDRSNLNEVVSIGFDGTKTTRRQQLERGDWMRTDVVLINGTRGDNQYLLFVTATGFTGDMWILDILSDHDHAQLQSIAAKMRENATEFPPAAYLITRQW